MVGSDNFESRSTNAREYNNSADFNESWKTKEFLNTVENENWATEIATELKNGDFEKNMSSFTNRGKEIEKNNLLEKYDNCHSTAVNVTKSGSWEKPIADMIEGISDMSDKIGIKNAEFTKLINKETGDTVEADLQWKIWDEINTVTYLSDCNYWKWSGSDEKCLIHAYGSPVYFADPPVHFA